jgi:hypothetical protein
MPEIRTVIVGTRFRGPDAVKALAGCGQGTAIILRAEPDNPHDSNAIACHANGAHLGYIPRRHNAPIAEAVRKGWVSGARLELEAIIDKGNVVAAPKISVTWEEKADA